MSTLQIIVVSFALAADAFAVSVCQGIRERKPNFKRALTVGLMFGFFQAVMPIIGYFIGASFEKIISSIDHWIAFFLLAFIGGKMFIEAFKGLNGNELCPAECADMKELVLLAVATSIDALAVGITYAVLGTGILFPAIAIGVITFATCFVGVVAGAKLGEKIEKFAEIIGGLTLILIGVKILFEHL